MRTVWKYSLLDPSWCGVLDIPMGAEFNFFAFQHTNPSLWFQVETVFRTERRQFKVVCTGHEIPDDGIWLASVQIEDKGAYWVWHLYEIK